MKRNRGVFLGVVMFAAAGVFAEEPDWPQWQGANRTGISEETGLLSEWPKNGPPVLWSIKTLGNGYGSVSILGDRLFVQGTQGRNSVVHCLNVANGRTAWTTTLGPALDHDRGGGPRGTPTAEGDRLYVLGENGDLASLRIADGSPIWRRNILTDFGGQNPKWLISESPLIDGDHVIVMPGGPQAGIVALNKHTGETVWTSRELDDPAAYSSSLVVDVGGIRTIIAFTSRAGVGVRATDGKLMWRYQPVANRTANITTPIYHDGKVFYTSAYSTGSALLDLNVDGDVVRAEEVYFSKEMQNHHGGVVLLDGYLYGFSNAILTCIRFDTGERVWRDRSVGKGSLTYADGHLYLQSEDNVVGIAEATPEGYREKGRFSIPDQGWPSWAHPVISRGRLFIRNQGMLTSYDIRAK